jgi:hypothetical protein
MVLDDPTLLNQVLETWTDAGVRGITVLDSTGVERLRRRAARNDLPTFLGFCRLSRTDRYCHCTLFAVVDEETVERVVTVTTAIVGDLNAPHTGILFTLPVGHVWGLAKCCPQATEAQETA